MDSQERELIGGGKECGKGKWVSEGEGEGGEDFGIVQTGGPAD